MPSSKEKVAVLGAGVVGSALGRLLARSGYPVIAVASRSFSSARRAARFIGRGARPFADRAAAARAADIVLLTTPDWAIGEVCREVATRGGFRPGQLVLHTSGFFSSRVLRAARSRGANVGGLNPLQSFASAEAAISLLPGTVFGWEGGEGGQGRLLRLIRSAGGVPLEISATSKGLYHAAAVLASNYTVGLFAAAAELFDRSRAGRTRKGSSEKALLPLFLGTAANLMRLGLPRALTGPIARGDLAVVRGHVRALRRGARSFLPLYFLLGRRTIPLGLAKGTLRPREAAALRKLLRKVR